MYSLPPDEQASVIAYVLHRRTPDGSTASLDAATASDLVRLTVALYGKKKKKGKGTGDADLDAFNAWAGEG